MMVLFLVFEGISILSWIVAVSIYIPTSMQEGSLFSTPSPAFIACRLFDDGHSDWCEVIPHCSLSVMQESLVQFLGWKIPWRRDRLPTSVFMGFPSGSGGKESTCNPGDLGLIPAWEDPLEASMATHSSILAWRIPMDRGAWWAAVHRVTKSRIGLSD